MAVQRPGTNPYSWLYSYKSLLKHKHDAYIRQWAKAAEGRVGSARWNVPIIIRPFHEATGKWFPWSIGLKGNTVRNYKQAWRYLFNRSVNVGADAQQVRFLWSNYTPSRKRTPATVTSTTSASRS